VGERYIKFWAPNNGHVPFSSIITIWSGERFKPYIGGGGTAFTCVPLHFNYWTGPTRLAKRLHWPQWRKNEKKQQLPDLSCAITWGCPFRHSFSALTTMRLRGPTMHAHTKFKRNRRIEELNMSNSGTVHHLEFDRKWIFTIPRHDGSIENIQNLSCFSIM